MTTEHLDSKHGRPGKLEGYSPRDLGTDAVEALWRRLNPARAMRNGAAMNAKNLLFASDFLHGQDDAEVSLLNPGQDFYGGYYNGHYANLTALREFIARTTPKAHLLTVTPDGENGAMCGDFEPGCIWPIIESSVGRFYRNADHGGAVKPWLYCSAGNLSLMQRTTRALGIRDTDWFPWSAHYNGVRHFCGPHTCGYGLFEASATQYSDGQRDYDIAQDYCFSAAPKPTPPAPPRPTPPGPAAKYTWRQWPASVTLKSGSDNTAVRVLQTALANSGIVGVRGITVDGNFGGQTLTAVKNFQASRHLTEDGVAGPATRQQLVALNDL
jgi:peptidoglycan hydrolase-like protein with peptidoglycan-binding domain